MIKRIHHFGVIVRSLDSALDFYWEVLGLPIRTLSLQEGLGVKLALLRIGDTELELLEPVGENTPVRHLLQFLYQTTPQGPLTARFGETEGQITFESDDCHGDIDRLKAGGVQVMFQQDLPEGPIAILHPDSGRGVVMELYQPVGPPQTSGQAAPAHKAQRPDFRRVDHILVLTSDLADSIRRWETILARKASDLYRAEHAGVTVARLTLEGASLDLAQPLSPTGWFAEALRVWGDGVYSAGLEVADLGAAVTYLRKNGAELSDPGPGVWPGTRVVHISPASAHGLLLHLVQAAA